MQSISSVIENIITVGKNNDWFIPMILVDYSDYIYSQGISIYIHTSCLKMFMEPDSNNFSDEELGKFLLEMIHANIKDAKEYIIEIIISDNFLNFNATY